MNDLDIDNLFRSALKKIAPDTDPGKLRPDDLIQQTLALDSFDFLQFIIAVSESLKISIPEEDYSKVNTLKGLHLYMKTKRVLPG